MKALRTASAAIFLVSIPIFAFTLFGENPRTHAITTMMLFGSFGAFCFTEGFMFKSPTRTKFNIYAARFMFAGACAIVAQIIFALFVGQIQ